MYKLKVNNAILSIIFTILGIAACTAIAYFSAGNVAISIFLLLAASLVFILIVNLLLYTKARTNQVLLITLFNLSMFSIILISSGIISKISGAEKFAFNKNLQLHLNAISAGISLLSSLLSTYVFFGFEKIDNNNHNNNVEVDIDSTVTPSVAIINEKNIQTAPVDNKPTVTEPVNTSIEPVSSIPVNEPQAVEPEDIILEKEGELDALPDINLDITDNEELIDISQEKNTNNNIPYSARLKPKTSLKAELSDEKKLSSVGKLLINQRDLENIIETNALVQNVRTDSAGCVSIISSVEGNKLKEKLEKIRADFNYMIGNIIVFNTSGLVISSTYTDKLREQTIGAVYAGLFNTTQNYIDQLNKGKIQKLIYCAEDVQAVLSNVNNKLVYFEADKSLKVVDYGELSSKVYSHSMIHNIEALKDINTIKRVFVLDQSKTENTDKNTSILSALFENTEIFISELFSPKLESVFICTDTCNLGFIRESNKIIVLELSANSPIKFTQELVKIDECISQEAN